MKAAQADWDANKFEAVARKWFAKHSPRRTLAGPLRLHQPRHFALQPYLFITYSSRYESLKVMGFEVALVRPGFTLRLSAMYVAAVFVAISQRRNATIHSPGRTVSGLSPSISSLAS
jgi:hypothetical protein